jgi:hypothetical protein
MNTMTVTVSEQCHIPLRTSNLPIWLAVSSAGITVRAAPNRVFWRVGIPSDQPGPDLASSGYAAMNDAAGQSGQPVLGGRCRGQ